MYLRILNLHYRNPTCNSAIHVYIFAHEMHWGCCGHNSQASFEMLSMINDTNSYYWFAIWLNKMYKVYISWYWRCPYFDNDIMVPGGFVKKTSRGTNQSNHRKNYINTRGLDKMSAILQTIFSDAFSWMQIYEFRLRFQRYVLTSFQLTIFQLRFR